MIKKEPNFVKIHGAMYARKEGRKGIKEENDRRQEKEYSHDHTSAIAERRGTSSGDANASLADGKDTLPEVESSWET